MCQCWPVKSTSLIGEFVGEGARQIHSLYEKAEEMAPCIIFIDELDAIALDRRYQDLRGDVSEMVNSLLTEMDGLSSRTGRLHHCGHQPDRGSWTLLSAPALRRR